MYSQFMMHGQKKVKLESFVLKLLENGTPMMKHVGVQYLL